MFKNPFSFDGRIRRTEYGVSFIIYAVLTVIVNAIISSSRDAGIVGIVYVPMFWFLFAQGAKRCHDLGNNGWLQIIPFYTLWLLFQDGQSGANEYGENPKRIQTSNQQNYTQSQTQQNFTQTQNHQSGYQGGYTGGHNNPNSNQTSPQNPQNKDGYNNGDLYK